VGADLLGVLAFGTLVAALAAAAIRAGIILGGRLDSRLQPEEDEPDA